MLEEKNKMAEMMNEANNLYEEGMRGSIHSGAQSPFIKGHKDEIDLNDLIKPQYLDEYDQNKQIDNLPCNV